MKSSIYSNDALGYLGYYKLCSASDGWLKAQMIWYFDIHNLHLIAIEHGIYMYSP